MYTLSRRLSAFSAAIAAAAFVSTASAQTYNEVGDAGDFPAGTAQDVTGTGALSTIVGATGANDLVDAYLINITDPDIFSASTDNSVTATGGLDPVSGFDTRMLLFEPDGTPLLGAEDDPNPTNPEGFDFVTYLSGPDIFPVSGGDPSTEASLVYNPPQLSAGPAVLVLTGWDNNAFDDSGTDTLLFGINIEPAGDNVDLYGVFPESTGVFGSYENDASAVDYGAYQIDLVGASFIPEPTSLSLLGLAGLGLLRRRR